MYMWKGGFRFYVEVECFSELLGNIYFMCLIFIYGFCLAFSSTPGSYIGKEDPDSIQS